MSATIIEQTRAAHEEVERTMSQICNDLKKTPQTHRDKILQQHRVNKKLEQIQERSKALLKVYADEDGSRAQEIAELGQADMFGMFYAGIRDIHEYHRKFPNAHYEQDTEMTEVTAEDENTILSRFSGEECYGRFVDLHYHHRIYSSLPQFPQLDYQTFVLKFEKFEAVPLNLRLNQGYLDYLSELYQYFIAFHRRAQPLQNLDAILSKRETEIANEWAQVLHHEPQSQSNNNNNNNNAWYCAACSKQLSSQGVFDGHLKGKKHLKAAKEHAMLVAGMETHGKLHLRQKIFRLEKLIGILVEVLREQLDGTLLQIEKKQSRTLAELEAEQEQEEEVAADTYESEEEEDSDEEKPIYNPKGVPLGWDGKPIPYWLYKLHGLNIEYKCEICGNVSYWGPRAFERHFQESLHSACMRQLNIPNTKHFHNVTQIQDAIDLYHRLQKLQNEESFRPDLEEEFEDADGNVMTKKTYEDLKRQGLL